MRVRIHKPWQDNATAKIESLGSGCFRQGFDFRARPDRCDLAITHQQRSIFDDGQICERRAAARAAAAQRQELRCARNEQRIRQGPAIMPDTG